MQSAPRPRLRNCLGQNARKPIFSDKAADCPVRPIAAKGSRMRWVVWSEERGRWWGPGRMGYVDQLADAGRYSEAEARVIERNGNFPTTPPDFKEIAMPDPL